MDLTNQDLTGFRKPVRSSIRQRLTAKCLSRCLFLFLITSVLFLAYLVACPFSALAWNQLPFSTDSPHTIPAGQVAVDLGLQFLNRSNFLFSDFSETFHRDVWSIPTLGANVGVGKRAEIQLSYEVLFVEEEEFQIKERWKSGDITFFTKVALLAERTYLPALGIKFGAKLPNARDAYRVGTDESDLAFMVLCEKKIASVTATTNIGALILGNPFVNATQDDLLTYGVAVRRPCLSSLAWMAELTGQTLGTAHNERASAILRLLFEDGPCTWNFSGRVGLLENSENWGLSGGVRIRWNAWRE